MSVDLDLDEKHGELIDTSSRSRHEDASYDERGKVILGDATHCAAQEGTSR